MAKNATSSQLATPTIPRSAPFGASEVRSDTLETERQVMLAFAPVHKRAMGVATGVATALFVAVATLITVIDDPAQRFPLQLRGAYFYGFDLSWRGLFVGTGWGFTVGFVAGWFIAFCRNLAVAISIFAIRTRAEISQTRDFLDHI